MQRKKNLTDSVKQQLTTVKIYGFIRAKPEVKENIKTQLIAENKG